MSKLKNASKPPFYKTGPLYFNSEDQNATDPSPKSDAKKKADPDPVKYFKSFGSKATQRTAANPYPKDSERYRKFAGLQKRVEDSSF